MKELNWFYDELFRINFYICIDFNHKELEEAIEKQFGLCMELSPTATASCVEVLMNDGRFGIFIRVKNQDYESLVHEVTHASNKVFQRIGHQISVDNDEVQAYYNQYLFKRILLYMKEGEENDKNPDQETPDRIDGVSNRENESVDQRP